MLAFIISQWQGPSSLAHTLTLQICTLNFSQLSPVLKERTKEKNPPMSVSHSPHDLMLLTITSQTVSSCTNKFQMSHLKGGKGNFDLFSYCK